MIGPAVSRVVRDAFLSYMISRTINDASMVATFNLIHPINLCNTVYKVISKILSSRIKLLYDKLISPNQAAFVSKRWIVENSILVNEIVHNFRKRNMIRVL